MNILISGASGLIGSAVLQRFRGSGHQVARLVRRAPIGPGEVEWNMDRLEAKSLMPFDAVIHLAGKTVAGRWNDYAKKQIIESRVRGTTSVAQAVGEARKFYGRPNVLISASAIGYYGSQGDERLTEDSGRGRGFLADVAEAWESATASATQAGVRVVMPRIGLVLSRKGGALAKMLPLFRLGLAGKIGSGHQYWSWITLDDVVRVIEFALNSSISGPVNAVAPNPVTNEQFTKTLAAVLHRPAVFPLPAFMARVMFAEAADELMLSSQFVLPKKLQEAGFEFRDTELKPALENVLR